MTSLGQPSEENHYLAAHVAILRRSYRHWTRRSLLDPRMNDEDAARYLYAAPLVVVSHDASPDPKFNYANRTALSLFAMTWGELTALPSRMSVERDNQEERERLLAEVTANGYVDHYQGVRIGRHGRRFQIENATIWNLLDERGVYCGQAACFKHWTLL
jgi:hypothetical protein